MALAPKEITIKLNTEYVAGLIPGTARLKAERDFLAHVLRGGCLCCFPEWEYDGISVQDVWIWIDEYDLRRLDRHLDDTGYWKLETAPDSEEPRAERDVDAS